MGSNVVEGLMLGLFSVVGVEASEPEEDLPRSFSSIYLIPFTFANSSKFTTCMPLSRLALALAVGLVRAFASDAPDEPESNRSTPSRTSNEVIPFTFSTRDPWTFSKRRIVPSAELNSRSWSSGATEASVRGPCLAEFKYGGTDLGSSQ